MAYSFKPKKGPRRKPDDPAHESDYLKRNDMERERRALATDASFYSVWSFHNKKEFDEFREFVGLPDGEHVDARVLESRLSDLGVSERHRHAFSPGFSEPDVKADNPYKGVKYSGSVEVDARAEFMALFGAMTSVKPRDHYKSVVDSRFWMTFIFRSSAELESFMDRFGFAPYGYQYADGSKIFESIRGRASA